MPEHNTTRQDCRLCTGNKTPTLVPVVEIVDMVKYFGVYVYTGGYREYAEGTGNVEEAEQRTNRNT